MIRKSRDYVNGIREYNVRSVKQLFQSRNPLRIKYQAKFGNIQRHGKRPIVNRHFFHDTKRKRHQSFTNMNLNGKHRTWGKWIMQGPKHLSLIRKYDINEIRGNLPNPFFKKKVRGNKHPGDVYKCTNSILYIYHSLLSEYCQDDVSKWNHFPRYLSFVRGIHRSLVDSPHKGQWSGSLVYFFICAWINGSENNRYGGDLRRHRTHHDVTVMPTPSRG